MRTGFSVEAKPSDVGQENCFWMIISIFASPSIKDLSSQCKDLQLNLSNQRTQAAPLLLGFVCCFFFFLFFFSPVISHKTVHWLQTELKSMQHLSTHTLVGQRSSWSLWLLQTKHPHTKGSIYGAETEAGSFRKHPKRVLFLDHFLFKNDTNSGICPQLD